MRRAEIERIAEQLVRKVPEGPRPAINVNEVARQLGLPIVRADLGEGVSACLVTEAGRSYIGVRAEDHENRRRFSIAHEIGHYVLEHSREAVHIDRESSVSYRSVVYRTTRSASGDPREVEANQFAACLLMPANRVRREATKLGGAITDNQVDALASDFKVSPAAMAIRLQVLGLL